jgi:peptidoglycan hydrolase-like protein with peptidoglycan-binding domain
VVTAKPADAPDPVAAAVEPDPDTGTERGDDLTIMVQQHLTSLGYDPGNTNGELSTATIVAISQFQAENDLEVTGEVSPQLAGILAAKASDQEDSARMSPAELQAAQEACLQEKIAEAEAAQKKKRGFGSLLSGVGRVAAQMGNAGMGGYVGDVYQAGATADDFAQAAKDLGLTEEDVAECENPT